MISYSQALVICVGTFVILTWVFWEQLVIWWYRPWCVPCRRYTVHQVLQLERDETDSYYICPRCGRICEMDDAVRFMK